MTTGLKISQKRKSKLYSKKMKSLAENVAVFKTYNNIYNKLCRSQKQLYYDDQFKAHCNNSKKTQSFIS